MLRKYFSLLFMVGILLGCQHSKGLLNSDINQKTLGDARATLGEAPIFLDYFAHAGVEGAWQEFKSLALSKTVLDGKTKELVSLGVAAQIPCTYCVYFHTRTARLNGASDREIREAIAVASITRHWSTLVNGAEISFDRFKKDMARIFRNAKNQKNKAFSVKFDNTPEAAYQDIKETYGFIPSFIKACPKAAIAGAWRELKSVQLNPRTALSGKQKQLIALGVAAQIPCAFCVNMHSAVAKKEGASEEELREAIGSAALTRHWSTALNGSLVPWSDFTKNVDTIIENLKNSAG